MQMTIAGSEGEQELKLMGSEEEERGKGNSRQDCK